MLLCWLLELGCFCIVCLLPSMAVVYLLPQCDVVMCFCDNAASRFCLPMDSVTHQYKIMSWNIRGMNNSARQEDLKQIVTTFQPDLICIQETKIAVINFTLVRRSLGMEYENNFVFQLMEPGEES
jgi:hypothetical protein